MPSRLGIIKSHIEDAVPGAPPLYSAARMQSASASYDPPILAHVPEDSTEITDETFGPALAINPVTKHG